MQQDSYSQQPASVSCQYVKVWVTVLGSSCVSRACSVRSVQFSTRCSSRWAIATSTAAASDKPAGKVETQSHDSHGCSLSAQQIRCAPPHRLARACSYRRTITPVPVEARHPTTHLPEGNPESLSSPVVDTSQMGGKVRS